jgi:hypothetical protein
MRPLACVLVMVLVAAAGCNRPADAPPPQKQAPVAQVQVVDPLKGVFEKKGGEEKAKRQGSQSLLGRIRDKAVTTQRLNDLRQLALTFGSMPVAPRSLEQWKTELRQAPALVKLIDEKEITINLKARQFTNDIVAYESEPDTSGLVYAARASNTVDGIPFADLKKELGLP